MQTMLRMVPLACPTLPGIPRPVGSRKRAPSPSFQLFIRLRRQAAAAATIPATPNRAKLPGSGTAATAAAGEAAAGAATADGSTRPKTDRLLPTDKLDPSAIAALLLSCNVPFQTVVPPVYVLVPLRTIVPGPSSTRAIVPGECRAGPGSCR